MRRLTLFAFALCLVAMNLAAGEQPGATFSKTSITVTGFGKGNAVVFFGAGLIANGFDNGIVRWSEAVEDTDRDGSVTLETGREIPWRSIWIAADAKTGDFIAVCPSGYSFSRKDLVLSVSKDANGTDAIVSFPASQPYLLYVHPGIGTWAMKATPRDFISHGGVKVFSVANAQPVGATTGPIGALAPGGILIVIDTYSMTVSAARLTPAMFVGGGK